jgi:biopolymer transport protein ExbD
VLSVVLAAPSGTQVNGATLSSDDEVAGPAAQQFAKDHTVRAVIKADGRVPHERVMHVLDVLRQVGISRIAFGITPKPAAAPPAPPLTPAAQP